MALSVTQVAPALAEDVGGTALTLTGTFALGRTYQVALRDRLGQVLCYSGVSGRGQVCTPLNATTLACYTPSVPSGTYAVVVRDTQRTETFELPGAVTVGAPFLHSQVFALRQNMRPILRRGAVTPDELPAVARGLLP